MKKRQIAVIAFAAGLALTLIDGTSDTLKADELTIGYGDTLYTNPNVPDDKIQALVHAYNKMERVGEAAQSINMDDAVTVTFIQNDQIAAQLVIDSNGVFQTKDNVKPSNIADDTIYALAMSIFDDVHAQNGGSI